MIELKNGCLTIQICEETGYTSGLIGPDGYNWVLPKSNWGHVEGFDAPPALKRIPGGVRIVYTHAELPLEAVVCKTTADGDYRECYSIVNRAGVAHFMREGDFGIHLPNNSAMRPGENYMDDCANAHPWCAGNIAWLQFSRFNGKTPWLSVYMTRGNMLSYDISRDVSRAARGIDYRGAVVMNPQPAPIAPGEALITEFVMRLETLAPERAHALHPGHIALDAMPYTSLSREPIELSARYTGDILSAEVSLNGAQVAFSATEAGLRWSFQPSEYGEYTFYVTINGRSTWIRVNSLPALSELTQTRARFIADKQQYHCADSPLDGAYLIYDKSSDSQYYSARFADHNAGRERICMGLVVALALQKRLDPLLEVSLKKHIEFVERELFDAETGEVYNQIGRDNAHLRIYNSVWYACFYMELYKLYGGKRELACAAKIMRWYYANAGAAQNSQCIPMLEMVRALEKEDLLSEAAELKELFVAHADAGIRRKICDSSVEGTFAAESGQAMICYFAQAYLLTSDTKYLNAIESYRSTAESFFAFQPDVHMHGQGARHWDGYWFGAYMQYGDLYPHQWNALAGEMYYYLSLIEPNPEYTAHYTDIYLNNLCVYEPDGFAASSYLYPRKITLYSADRAPDACLPLGSAYGQRYDLWANEQDWALYYAAKRLLA